MNRGDYVKALEEYGLENTNWPPTNAWVDYFSFHVEEAWRLIVNKHLDRIFEDARATVKVSKLKTAFGTAHNMVYFGQPTRSETVFHALESAYITKLRDVVRPLLRLSAWHTQLTVIEFVLFVVGARTPVELAVVQKLLHQLYAGALERGFLADVLVDAQNFLAEPSVERIERLLAPGVDPFPDIEGYITAALEAVGNLPEHVSVIRAGTDHMRELVDEIDMRRVHRANTRLKNNAGIDLAVCRVFSGLPLDMDATIFPTVATADRVVEVSVARALGQGDVYSRGVWDEATEDWDPPDSLDSGSWRRVQSLSSHNETVIVAYDYRRWTQYGAQWAKQTIPPTESFDPDDSVFVQALPQVNCARCTARAKFG